MWPPSITNIMRKTLLTILALGAVAMMSCSKDSTPSQPIWPDDGDDETTETRDKPLDGGNIVVAHRGGSTEAGKGFPDNSIASLEYAMSLKCYASECDIYWTKDNKVVVAHADSECKTECTRGRPHWQNSGPKETSETGNSSLNFRISSPR